MENPCGRRGPKRSTAPVPNLGTGTLARLGTVCETRVRDWRSPGAASDHCYYVLGEVYKRGGGAALQTSVPASPQHAVDMVSIRNPRIDIRPASLPRHPSKKLQEGKRLCRRSRTLRDYLRTAKRGDFTFEMQRSSKRERWPASLAAVRETSRLLSFCWPTPRPLPCSSLDPRALVSRHAARWL